jgi:hypothetical protein
MFIQADYNKESNAWVSHDQVTDYRDRVFLNIHGERGDLINLVFKDTIEFASFVDRMDEILDEINKGVKI